MAGEGNGNLIGVIPRRLGPARAKSKVTLTVGFSFGDQKMLEDGSKALLVLYDLEQYKQHQAAFPDGEKGDELFVGPKQSFDLAPPDHEVAAGTGVLLTASVKFKSRKVGTFTQSFIDAIDEVKAVSSPAFEIAIKCQTVVDGSGVRLKDAKGTERPDEREVFVTGVSEADFAAFTEHGAAERSLAIRLLRSDLTEVLVSQLNPKHSQTNRPVILRYDTDQPRREVRASAKAPEDAPPPKPTRMPFDLTGEYIQLRNKDDDPPDPELLVTPGVLRIHHIGRAVCGWYSPLSSTILSASEPSTAETPGKGLFDPPFETLTNGRMIFVLGKAIPGSDNTFAAEAKFDSDELDPDDFFATDEEGEPKIPEADRVLLLVTLLNREEKGGSSVFRRIRIARAPVTGFEDSQEFTYARISANSRLSFGTVRQLLDDSTLDPAERSRLTKELTREFVEAVPPAVIGKLISAIVSPQMEALVAAVNFSSQPSERIFPAEEVGAALSRLARQLQAAAGELTTDLITQVRNAARAHDFKVDGKDANMLEALERISNEIVENKLAEDPQHKRGDVPLGLEDDIAELALSDRYFGFNAFKIRPSQNVLYKFEFLPINEATSVNFIILSATFGAFAMKISKLDRVTRAQLRQDFKETQFEGLFAAGAIGAGLGIEIDTKGKSKKKIGATIDSVNAEVVSFSDIPRDDFDGATFSIFATGAQLALGLGDVPGGGQVGAVDAVFSLTTKGVPPVTLEVEVKQFFKPDLKSVKISDIKDFLKKRLQKKKEGDAKAVATIEGALTALSLCKGVLALSPFADAPSPRAEKQEETAEKVRKRDLETNVRVQAAQFERQSAALHGKGRELLELRVAVLRKILEYPGWLDIEGTSSPEWDNATREQAAQKNIDLSRRRAETTKLALFAAAGEPGQGPIPLEKDIQVQGKGAEPHRERFGPEPSAPDPETGLQDIHLDPFTPLPSDPLARLQHEQTIENDKASFYPTLRRVDLIMNGVFVVRIPSK